jgi:voltage-gated potassium channel
VVVDIDPEHLRRLSDDLLAGELLHVVGDGTEDEVLLEAGVDRASGVVAALTHDKDNLVVTLSARSLNPKARIVAKITEAPAEAKMRKAGATSVVNPTLMGAHRLANEVLRPEVSRVMDTLLRSKDSDLKMDEMVIEEGNRYAGKALGATDIRSTLGLLVIALRTPEGELVFNPEAKTVLESGMTLIVLGPTKGIDALHESGA